MMIRALTFCAIVAVGSVGFYLGMDTGQLAGAIKQHAADRSRMVEWTAQATSTAWTDGFNNGVTCGLIAYTYAPDNDPAKTNVPIMTLRARYWYTALQATKSYLPTPPSRNETETEKRRLGESPVGEADSFPTDQ